MPFPLVLLLIILVGFGIIKYPELGFSLILMISVIKPLLQYNYSFFMSVDITLIFFLMTLFGLLYNYLFVIKKFLIPYNITVIYLLFLSLLGFTTLYTPTISYGLSKLIRFIFLGNILFFGAIVLFQNPLALRRFLIFSRYLTLILAISHIITLLVSLLSFDIDMIYVHRFAIAGNVIGSARIFGMGLFLWILALFQTKRTSDVIKCLFPILVLVLALISTNTRGPILSIILSIPLILIVVNKKSLNIIIFSILFLLVIGGLAFSAFPEQMTNRYLEQLTKPDMGGAEVFNLLSSTSRRLFLWKSATDGYFNSNIFESVLGHGLGSFSLIWPGYDYRFYPHNILLELIYECGLITLSLFIFLLFLTFRLFYKYHTLQLYLDFTNLFMFMLFIYFLLNSMVSGDINDNRLMLIFWGGTIGMISERISDIQSIP